MLIITAMNIHAQDDPEYKMEIGVGTGLLTYEGDYNGNIFKESQPMASFMLRRVLSPWMALRLNAMLAR